MMGIQIIANLIVDYHRIETIKKRVQNGIVNWACRTALFYTYSKRRSDY